MTYPTTQYPSARSPLTVTIGASPTTSALTKSALTKSARLTLAGIIAGLLMVAVSFFSAAAPASAHDELVGTSFEMTDDETSVAAVVLSYSAEILDVGTEIQVTDDAGADATGGAPETSGRDVTQPLAEGLEPGMYHVAWRVVSSDGHPIDGAFSFEISAEPGVVPTPLPYAGDDASATETEHDHEHDEATESHDHDEAESGSADTDEATAADEAEAGFPVGLTVGIIAVIVIAAAVWIIVAARRRRATGTSHVSGNTDSGSASSGSAE